jgi:hypothetical protein
VDYKEARHAQQRKNFADAKRKMGIHPMRTKAAGLLRKAATALDQPSKGFLNGSVGDYLGLSDNSLADQESRSLSLQKGLDDGVVPSGRHTPDYLSDYGKAQPEGVTHISEGLKIAASKDAEKVLGKRIPKGDLDE